MRAVGDGGRRPTSDSSAWPEGARLLSLQSQREGGKGFSASLQGPLRMGSSPTAPEREVAHQALAQPQKEGGDLVLVP